MSPDEARTIAAFLLSNLEAEILITVSVFQAVPGERTDYRPDGVSKTALGLLRQITLEDAWFLNAIADGHFAPLPDDSDACGIMTPVDAIARYKQAIPAAADRTSRRHRARRVAASTCRTISGKSRTNGRLVRHSARPPPAVRPSVATLLGGLAPPSSSCLRSRLTSQKEESWMCHP